MVTACLDVVEHNSNIALHWDTTQELSTTSILNFVEYRNKLADFTRICH